MYVGIITTSINYSIGMMLIKLKNSEVDEGLQLQLHS